MWMVRAYALWCLHRGALMVALDAIIRKLMILQGDMSAQWSASRPLSPKIP